MNADTYNETADATTGWLVLGAFIFLNGNDLSASQLAQASDWFKRMVPEGFELHLSEFVEPGKRPTDESLDTFLFSMDVNNELTAEGWRRFNVDYGTKKATVQTRLNDAGTRLLVRLDLIKVGGSATTQFLLMNGLAKTAGKEGGEFGIAGGILGLYLPLEAGDVTDVALWKAIDTVIAKAERTAPLWRMR